LQPSAADLSDRPRRSRPDAAPNRLHGECGIPHSRSRSSMIVSGSKQRLAAVEFCQGRLRQGGRIWRAPVSACDRGSGGGDRRREEGGTHVRVEWKWKVDGRATRPPRCPLVGEGGLLVLMFIASSGFAGRRLVTANLHPTAHANNPCSFEPEECPEDISPPLENLAAFDRLGGGAFHVRFDCQVVKARCEYAHNGRTKILSSDVKD